MSFSSYAFDDQNSLEWTSNDELRTLDGTGTFSAGSVSDRYPVSHHVVDRHRPQQAHANEYANPSTSDIAKQRLEFRAAQEVAAIKRKAVEEKARLDEELVIKRLALDLAELEQPGQDLNTNHSFESVRNAQSRPEREPSAGEMFDWTSRSQVGNEFNQVGYSRSSMQSGEIAMTRLSDTITQTFESINRNYMGSQNRMLHRLKGNKDIPIFDGDGFEWLHFKRAFELSTRLGNFTEEENANRLHMCLRGQAKEAVASLLMTGAGTTEIMDTLDLRFGNQDYILTKIVQEIKEIPNLGKEESNNILFLATKVKNAVAAMKAVKHYGYLHSPELLASIISKLPAAMVYHYNRFVQNTPPAEPKLETISRFLYDEARLACKAGTVPISFPSKVKDNKKLSKPFCKKSASNVFNTLETYSSSDQSDVNSCTLCESDNHSIQKCKKFSAQTIKQRWRSARKFKLCFGCLKKTHLSAKCPTPSCTRNGCSRKFNELLHWHDTSDKASTQDSGPKCRVQTLALLDEGSTVSLLDSKLANNLGLKGIRDVLLIKGVGRVESSDYLSERVQLSIKGVDSCEIHELRSVRTIRNMSLPEQKLNEVHLKDHLHLQDIPILYYKGKPRILLGQDYWHLIVSLEVRHVNLRGLAASRTGLGWVVHGNLQENKLSREGTYCFNNIKEEKGNNLDYQLQEMVKFYFRFEAIGISKCDRIDQNVEKASLLLKNYSRRIGDRWEAPLLWKGDKINLPDNKKLAMTRLLSLENKMDRDEEFKRAYCSEMKNLFDKGYAMKISDNGIIKKGFEGSFGKIWYLPHFGVRNQNKPGKIRLVHDAAAKFKGTSFNENMLVGPETLQPLPSVIVKFRQRPIAFTADIKEMFMQIKIRKEDWSVQRFLWRGEDRVREPDTYAMTSMIFGSACSPSTALYIRDRNAREFEDEFPEASRAIIQRHYVDDYLDSVNSTEDAIKLIKEVSEIHRRGGFEIRGWVCNDPTVLEMITGKDKTPSTVDLNFGIQTFERVLGLKWNPAKDTLSFAINLDKIPEEVLRGQVKPTKREMLRLIMSIFDPLGTLYPYTIRNKILLQAVWRSGIGWDEVLAEEEFKLWRKWITELKLVVGYEIPRCYNLDTNYDKIELHVFADASETGYAAVAYWKFEFPDRTNKISFIMGKARVAPLKPQSVPRMELQAALVASRLGKTIIESSDFQPEKRIFWSDSHTVLRWIYSNPWEYKTFVSHRLGEIDELTSPNEWRWVPSSENPADAGTKWSGSTEERISYWNEGPKFLLKSSEYWPQQPILSTQRETGEERNRVLMTITEESCLPDLSRFSKWLRLIRTTARLLLVSEILRRKNNPVITVELMERAELLWIRRSQDECFGLELKAIQSNKQVPIESKLSKLTPILDKDNILVVDGRLSDITELPQRSKSPPILDGRHPYVRLLIQGYHERFEHGNTETVINELRQSFCILKIRSVVRSVIHHCQFCKIRRAKPQIPRMGNLPPARTAHHQRPFSHCGIDYFGPMVVAVGRRQEKRWGVIFTCLTTRAVHIELAASLTTDSAIMALRRMVARRGHPSDIYSDNGTNLRGASTELKTAVLEMEREKQQEYATNRGARWHFLPPTTPHMGGCWERLVRSIKVALKVTLKERTPREETLYTLLTEVEHTINCRPLTYVSVDSNGLEALTPNHFLIGSSSNVPLPGRFDRTDLFGRKQWRFAQVLADMFWRRWLREYLPELSPRRKWTRESKVLKTGEVVIVVDTTQPRNSWPKGIIERTYPGNDGRVRVVEVRTTHGVLKRPTSKIIPLDVSKEGTD